MSLVRIASLNLSRSLIDTINEPGPPMTQSSYYLKLRPARTCGLNEAVRPGYRQYPTAGFAQRTTRRGRPHRAGRDRRSAASKPPAMHEPRAALSNGMDLDRWRARGRKGHPARAARGGKDRE